MVPLVLGNLLSLPSWLRIVETEVCVVACFVEHDKLIPKFGFIYMLWLYGSSMLGFQFHIHKINFCEHSNTFNRRDHLEVS